MRVLVAYGSRFGGTEGLARSVGDGLAAEGHQVAVRRAGEIDGLQGWDAVVVGGGLYGARWYRPARSFVKRHLEELSLRPVWFFSSGPLDDSASQRDIPATGPVRRLMSRVLARGHATFGGRLDPGTARGMARVIAQKTGGDWRDLNAARAWGGRLAAELSALSPRRLPAAPVQPHVRERVRFGLAALCLFTGVTACLGAVGLLSQPRGSGSAFVPPVSLLEGTPFRTFIVPGLLLLLVVGFSNLAAWVLVLRRHRHGELFAFGAGAALTGYIVVELALLGATHWLQWLYLVVGVATLATSLWLWRTQHAFARLRPSEAY